MTITVYRMVFLEGAAFDTVLEFCVSRAVAEKEMVRQFRDWADSMAWEADSLEDLDESVPDADALAWCLARPDCRIEEVVVEDAEALVKLLDEYGGWCRDHA